MAHNRVSAGRSSGRKRDNTVADVSPLRAMREGRVDNMDAMAALAGSPEPPYTRFHELSGEIQKEICYQHELTESLAYKLSSLLIPEEKNSDTGNPAACAAMEPTEQLEMLAGLLNRHRTANARLARLIERIYL